VRVVASLLLAGTLFIAASPARADFIDSGFFATGFDETGFFEADGAPADIPVPNVVGEADSAAADAILEGDGLDLGTVTTHCSAAALDEIIGQDPLAGVLVSLGTLVNVTASDGMACPPGSGSQLNIILRLRQ